MAVSSPDAVDDRARELPKPGPHVLVLFGATGDLARRKLLEHPSPLQPYEPGSWGPDEKDALIAPRHWRLPFERKWRGSA